jgi:hypothetical protein
MAPLTIQNTSNSPSRLFKELFIFSGLPLTLCERRFQLSQASLKPSVRAQSILDAFVNAREKRYTLFWNESTAA